ncbi:hypothetical protein L0Y65_04170 [Candidatus Micrarchaeota archaeon]|nr:hypothetical protein [Candidatus Micrarchaeota archaeon]
MERELAELVGILLGDGSLGIYKSRPNGKTKLQHRIKISLNSEKDAEYANYISSLFAVIFHKRPTLRKRKESNTLDLYLLGREHLEFLVSEGLVLAPKWQRAVIPARFLAPPLDLLVLRGYMDTDGCIAAVNNNGIRYPRIEMKISPAPMQGQLMGIMGRNGFRPQINRLERGKVRVVLAGNENLARWNATVGFSNERNLRVARSFLDASSTKQPYKRLARY